MFCMWQVASENFVGFSLTLSSILVKNFNWSMERVDKICMENILEVFNSVFGGFYRNDWIISHATASSIY